MADIDAHIPFPVMGIGASAGGLEAVQALLSPTIGPDGDGSAPDTGMAIVLVQHLDPNHSSMLADLLSRRTTMGVRQVEDGDRLAPDTVFVIQPGSGLEIEEGAFRLVPFDEPRGLRRPIDDFFASLARACGENCAGVVVSGTGSDGAMGLRAIKEAGGFVVVQDPDEAKYDGMPSAAIATGLADKTLASGRILSAVIDYFRHPVMSAAGHGPGDEVVEHLEDLTEAVADATGHDFSGYKHSTMIRRVRRRMQVTGVDTVAAYLERLRDDEDEPHALVTDLLINVTRFFRDPSAFQALADRAVSKIVEGKGRADTLRVWVPGCSSGEEAYTIAMILARALEGVAHPPFVQVFATDIDEQMLAVAKLGRYPITAMSSVPEGYHDYCNVQASGHFTVASHIRDMVRFSSHSLIKDPPFSRLDLISCRNLLIYLNSRLQKGVIPLFHYALKPGGFLFLGPAESLGRREDLFDVVDRPARLYSRREGRTPGALTLPVGGGMLRRMATRPPHPGALPTPTQGLAQRRILDAYAPAYLTVSETGDVVESSGQLARYLDIPAGKMTRHVGALARKGLREPLTRALRLSMESKERQVLRDLRVESEFGEQAIDLVVDPLPDNTHLVVIRDVEAFRAATEDDLTSMPDADTTITSLEAKLDTTRLELRTTVEELETTNEELKSSNEEMMSMNEELQSANEELTTLNDELKSKIDKLAKANDDQANFLASTDLALIVLGSDLGVRMFTDAATDIYPLTEADLGRPLGNFQSFVDDAAVIDDAVEVMRTGREITRAVSTRSDSGRVQSYTMRILPYRTADGSVDGATLTFTDTTILRDAQRTAEESGDRLKLALEATDVGVWEYYVEDGETVIDPRVRELFGLPADFPLKSSRVEEIFGQVDPRDLPAMQKSFDRALDSRGAYRAEFRIAGTDPVRWISGAGRVIDGADGRRKLTGVNYDITEIKTAQYQQFLLVRELDHRVKNLFAIVLGMLRAEARRAPDTPTLVANIESRMSALARAHEASRGSRSGNSYTRTNVRDLVTEVMSPYGVGDRVHVEGPKASLPASSVTPLGLVLHELATNAQKYGSLSRDEGVLDITWSRVRGEDGKKALEFRWTESGGPAVAEPDKPGFGMRLVRQSVAQLGGRLELDWRSGGLDLTMVLPLDRVEPPLPATGA